MAHTSMKRRSRAPENIRARNAVFRLLKIRLRSEKEIRDKLHTKGFSPAVIDETVDYFTQIDLVNDRVFVRKWISSRLAKPFGSNRIRFELKSKGIQDDILNEELASALDCYPEEEVVRELALRRRQSYDKLDPVKVRQRLYGYLARRGFNAGVIHKVLRQL